jgi:uncharacterized protein involved in cysteine biosynthesis
MLQIWISWLIKVCVVIGVMVATLSKKMASFEVSPVADILENRLLTQDIFFKTSIQTIKLLSRYV